MASSRTSSPRSRASGALFVIARNSSFTYKGRAVDVRQVGRELGVRYVLEGSVRRAGGRVRITGQLIDASNGSHLWADRFDGALEDIFELQDRITESVVGAIEPSVHMAEVRRAGAKPTENLDAYDLYLRALTPFYRMTRDGLEEALRMLRQAIALDPQYAFAKAFAAFTHVIMKSQNWTTDEQIAEGVRFAHEALVASRDDPSTLALAAHPLAYLNREFDLALSALDRALFLNPNSASVLARSAWVRMYVSQPEKAMEQFHRVIRLSPLDPEMAFHLCGLAYAYMIASRYDEALGWARKSLEQMPLWTAAWRCVAVSAAYLGRTEEAEAAAERILALSPSFSLSQCRRWIFFRDDEITEMFIEGLRRAGIPRMTTRRLAAILAADVVGFSSMMK